MRLDNELDKNMAKNWTTFTLAHWNRIAHMYHTEISIAGGDASIRLLCGEFANGLGKRCGAHYFDDEYILDKKSGEKLCRVICNACSKAKTRKLGKFVGDHE